MSLLDVFLTIGSAHAGEPLTHEALMERLLDPTFRARFNGPPPAEVVFADEQTAATATAFENAGKRGVKP